VYSDAAEGSDGAIRLCREIYMADPDRYFYPDQYNNPANWKRISNTPAQRLSTRPADASPISSPPWAPAHFMGTRGASSATCRSEVHLRAAFQRLPWLEGLKHMPTALCPHLRRRSADGNLWMETEDAYRMCAAWPAKRACWWAFHRAAMCTPLL